MRDCLTSAGEAAGEDFGRCEPAAMGMSPKLPLCRRWSASHHVRRLRYAQWKI